MCFIYIAGRPLRLIMLSIYTVVYYYTTLLYVTVVRCCGGIVWNGYTLLFTSCRTLGFYVYKRVVCLCLAVCLSVSVCFCVCECLSVESDLSDLSGYTFFYRQLDFPSEPGVANEILENEAKSCLATPEVVSFIVNFYTF